MCFLVIFLRRAARPDRIRIPARWSLGVMFHKEFHPRKGVHAGVECETALGDAGPGPAKTAVRGDSARDEAGLPALLRSASPTSLEDNESGSPCLQSLKDMGAACESEAARLGVSDDTYAALYDMNLLRPSTHSGVMGIRRTTYGSGYFVRHTKKGHVGSFRTKQGAADAMIALVRGLGVDSEASDDPHGLVRPQLWEQRLRACMHNSELRAFLQGKQTGADSLLPNVRKYYTEHEPATIELLFGDAHWQVDHIMPQKLAGVAGDLLENLVLMEEHANKHFGAHVGKLDEKRAFVGERIFRHAESCVHHEQKRPRFL